MSSRDMILHRLKAAPRTVIPAKPAFPPNPAAPARKEDMFIEMATLAGAVVQKADSFKAVSEAIATLVKDSELRSAVVSTEPIIEQAGVVDSLRSLNVQVSESSDNDIETYRKTCFHADVGITGCNLAIAETGSVVILHSPENQRLLSLAPNHYVCLLTTDQILTDRFALADYLAASKTELPSAATMITGISRTADVAMTVVLGMHGPRRVDIILITTEDSE